MSLIDEITRCFNKGEPIAALFYNLSQNAIKLLDSYLSNRFQLADYNYSHLIYVIAQQILLFATNTTVFKSSKESGKL